MKRCPNCQRDYFDDSLVFCLDDGAKLLDGPASRSSSGRTRPSEAQTIHFTHDHEAAERPEDIPAAGKGIRWKPFAAAAAVILAAALVLSVYLYFYSEPDVSIKSLAVLPLENLSGDAEQEFISDGMTEAIISNLSQIGPLRVVSRTSVMRYKKSGKTIPEIASELNVDGIVEGSVQRSADMLRVNVQLVHGATDSPVWSNRYMRPMSDILKLESEIAWTVASEIKIELTPGEEKRITNQKSIDPRAAEAALLGRHYFKKFTAEGTKRAVAEFQKAVDIQPDYADAWAGLADAWTASAMNQNMKMSEARLPTKLAAEKALELDPENAAGHIAMCFYKNNYEFDWVGGEEHCKRGIELSPNNSTARFAYAFFLSRLERWDEVSTQMEEAMRVDPDEPWWPSTYAEYLVQARRMDKVPSVFDRARQFGPAWATLSQLKRYERNYEESLKEAEKENAVISAARAYALMGNRKMAEAKLKEASPNDLFGPILVYTALGDMDKAFEMLNTNLDNNEGFMGAYVEFLELDKLRSDPRWDSVLRRMNRK